MTIMTVQDTLNVLFRRKVLILVFFLTTLAGGYAGLRLIAPTYEATARLLVRIGSEDIYMPALRSSQFRTPVMSVVREEQLRSEANILTDGDLAKKVVTELTPQVLFPGIDVQHPWYTPRGVLQFFNETYRAMEDYFFPLSSNRTLDDRAVTAFQRALKSDAIKSSNLIEVSFRNKSPDAAAQGVNTLIKLYLSERVRIFQREQSGFFNGQLTQLNNQMRDAEAAIEAFRAKGNFVDLDKQRLAQIDSLNDLRKRIDENRVNTSQLDRRIKVLRQQLSTVPPTVQTGDAESSNSFAISELSKQLADIQRAEADIKQNYSDSDPRLNSLREQRRTVQSLLDEQQARRYSSSQQGANPLNARIRDDLLRAEAELAGLQQAGQNLSTLEREVTLRLGDFNKQDSGDKQLAQKIQVLRETRQLYLEKAEESRLATAQAEARYGNVTVVSYASPPTAPVSPKLWLVLVGVLAGGLFGALALAFALEFFDDSLKSEDDVRRLLKLPVLAKVPDLNA
jgi:polysaccharide biosynthesis protein PslE